MQPVYALRVIGVELWRKGFGMVENSDGDIGLSRQVVKTGGERGAAVRAEAAAGTCVDGNLFSFIGRKGQVLILKGGEHRNRRSCRPATIDAMTIGNRERGLGRAKADGAAIAAA